MITKRNFTEAVARPQSGKPRKYRTVPDQSLSVDEIMRRFVRGIPVDVQQREAVYIDQQDYDLEKMSRMDFGEKAAMAAEVREQGEARKAAFDERQRAREVAKERARAKKEQPPEPSRKASDPPANES